MPSRILSVDYHCSIIRWYNCNDRTHNFMQRALHQWNSDGCNSKGLIPKDSWQPWNRWQKGLERQ